MAGRTNMRRPVQGPDAAPLPAFRTALVNRLRAARSYTVVTIVAPLGYGKTTLLSQWASRDDRPFVRLEDGGLDTRWAAATEPTLLVVDDADLLDDKGAATVARLISERLPGRRSCWPDGRWPGCRTSRSRGCGRPAACSSWDLATWRCRNARPAPC